MVSAMFWYYLKDQASRILSTSCTRRVEGSFWCKHHERGNANIRNMQHMGSCVRAACHFVKSQSCGELWIMDRMLQPGQASWPLCLCVAIPKRAYSCLSLQTHILLNYTLHLLKGMSVTAGRVCKLQ